MDYWFEAEIRAHRHRLLANAANHRRACLVRAGKRKSMRAKLADWVQVLSDRLAHTAAAMRGTERA